MKNKKFYGECFLILILSASGVLTEEEPLATLNSTHEDTHSHHDDTAEQAFSSSTISEKVPESVGIPKSNNPNSHHHEKHRNTIDSVNSHTRSPVYEVVNQPCYAPGCGGYGPQDGFTGNRWQPGRNRYAPYPKYVEPAPPRRRGGYGYPARGGYGEFYPQAGYGSNYGPSYPEINYGPRGQMPFYPQDRYDRISGYGRAPYDDYFLG